MDDHKPPYQWQTGWRCPHCHMVRGEDGHDPCLGELPGVQNACCGHGDKTPSGGYVHFTNGKVIRFDKLNSTDQ